MTKQVQIKTAHFEGTRTSYDWQSYEVEVVKQNTKTITLRCSRLIEGRTRRADGTYVIKLDSIRPEAG